MLCVLLLHALLVLGFFASIALDARRYGVPRSERAPAMLLLLFDEPEQGIEAQPEPPTPIPRPPRSRPPAAAAASQAPASDSSAAITARPWVDWPIEARHSAARVLEKEREAERIAKMFAGPDGTWASLTKRQRSQLNKFRWAPGVEGLKYDDKGNAIYTLPTGCTIVNFMFFGCPLGKPKVHDNMFDNMRLYFDEQRLPETNEGNGTEPEALRPPR
jgi:hypothetical protein